MKQTTKDDIDRYRSRYAEEAGVWSITYRKGSVKKHFRLEKKLKPDSRLGKQTLLFTSWKEWHTAGNYAKLSDAKKAIQKFTSGDFNTFNYDAQFDYRVIDKKTKQVVPL